MGGCRCVRGCSSGVDLLPPHPNDSDTARVEVFYVQVMIATVEVFVARFRAFGATVPVVNDQVAIHPYPHAVVHCGVEAIGPGMAEMLLTAPPHREVVGWHAGAGRSGAPVEVDIGVVTDQDGVARQVTVAVIMPLPVWVARFGTIPPQANLRRTGAVGIFEAQVMVSAADIMIHGESSGASFVPLVDKQLPIQPQANAAMHKHREVIVARTEAQAAYPPYREVVGRDVRGRGAVPPVEIDPGIVSHQHGRTVQVGVVVVLPFPVRIVLLPAFPPELGHGPADVLIILDTQEVVPRRDKHIGDVGDRAGVVPLVNDKLVVYPNTHTVIDTGVEAIVPAFEILHPGPANRKVVGGQVWRRRAVPPVEIDGDIVAQEDRLAVQVPVSIVFPLPIRK